MEARSHPASTCPSMPAKGQLDRGSECRRTGDGPEERPALRLAPGGGSGLCGGGHEGSLRGAGKVSPQGLAEVPSGRCEAGRMEGQAAASTAREGQVIVRVGRS